MQFYGYNIQTGQLAWGPTEPYDNAWGMYTSSTIGLGASNPKLNTGLSTLLLTTENFMPTTRQLANISGISAQASSGFETPYGTYPLGSGIFSIADGKVYVCYRRAQS